MLTDITMVVMGMDCTTCSKTVGVPKGTKRCNGVSHDQPTQVRKKLAFVAPRQGIVRQDMYDQSLYGVEVVGAVGDEYTGRKYFFVNAIGLNPFSAQSDIFYEMYSGDESYVFIRNVRQSSTIESETGKHFNKPTKVLFIPKRADELKLTENGEVWVTKWKGNSHERVLIKIPEGYDGMAFDIVPC